MAIEVSHGGQVVCVGLSVVERDGFVRGRVDACKWSSYRIISTLRNVVSVALGLWISVEEMTIPTRVTTLSFLLLSPIMSIVFVTSDTEFMIHCQVGLLDGARIICRFELGSSETLFSSDELLQHSSLLKQNFEPVIDFSQ